MSWSSAIRNPVAKTTRGRGIELFEPGATARSEPTRVDWDRLVSLDFETYYDDQYTLSKLSTSEYIRDVRFKDQMVGIKIGRGKTKIYPAGKIAAALRAINWKTHALLAHNVAFDGFILSHHYGIVPAKYYDTLSMARGLHSNEIGAGLEEVSIFYGGQGKIKDTLETTKGVLVWTPAMNKAVGGYCANDVDEMYRIFKDMVQVYPQDETDLIHITARMFCNPTLRVNIPRVQAEYEREVAKRKELLLAAITDPRRYDYKNDKNKWVSVLDKKAGRDELEGEERDMAVAKKVLGSNEKFVELLLEAGVPEDSIPRKISKAWMKLNTADREANLDSKWSYAFAKDDLEFVDLPERVWELHPEWDPNKPKDIMRAVVFSEKLRALVDARLITKSTTNITRAERFLKAGENGMPLPVGYNYAAAHTLRWGGANKMNMQNLTRGGELRLSIEAAVARAMAVCDSGQIEARVNGWLWGQEDLLEAFRKSDAYDREVADLPKEKRRKMRADERDAYCRFADNVYGRTVWKDDKDERFLGKVCVLGLGFQMGVDKFQMTLAKGALGGPRVNFTRDHCGFIVNTYRTLNYKIVEGWKKCASIIEDMSAGVSGSHKCISWGGDGQGNGWILLPNGMHLKYPDLKQTRNEERGFMEWSYQSKEMRKKIYGGLLCENLVQALARIIVATQMLWIDKKYPCVMTTHDEVVTHPTLKTAEKCYQHMYKCMTTPLWWCPDLPLAAEGGWATNYSK
jgi:DNA polymerase